MQIQHYAVSLPSCKDTLLAKYLYLEISIKMYLSISFDIYVPLWTYTSSWGTVNHIYGETGRETDDIKIYIYRYLYRSTDISI